MTPKLKAALLNSIPVPPCAPEDEWIAKIRHAALKAFVSSQTMPNMTSAELREQHRRNMAEWEKNRDK